MSIQRHDLRTQAPQKYGKPAITYPYGDTRFPRIVEMRTAKKGTDSALLIPFLTPYRDQRSYPGAVLIEQVADRGDDTDKNITETYEVLPGPIFVEVSADQDTGIPVLVSKQKRAATDIFDEGELSIGAFNVASITAGNPCTVTLDTTEHLLSPRMWMTFAGTGTALDGNQRILGVPADNQLTFAVDVASAAGAGGTMTPVNRIIREIKTTENVNVNVKIDSCVAAVDVTVYNEDIGAWKEYSFPDYLMALHGYRDSAFSETTGSTEAGFTITGDGTYGLQIQNGYRGQCQAQRLRLFAMGPAAISAAVDTYTPTLILPASGTVAIKATSISTQVTSGGETTATSYTYKSGTIPPVLTVGGAALGAGISGFGQAQFYVDLPASTPTGFAVGDIITMVEQPQKLRCGLWQVYVWRLTVPYTMGGGPPATLSYTPGTATYTVNTLISDNVPSYSGGIPNSFSISPALPAGLVMDGTTGIISGTPTAASGATSYTVTATNSLGSTTVSFTLTVDAP